MQTKVPIRTDRNRAFMAPNLPSVCLPYLEAAPEIQKRHHSRRPQADLQESTGPGYLIASTPTYIEKFAHNAIESFALIRATC